MKNKVEVNITDESILINNNGEEVVGWHVDEWTEDPSIVPSIANAINLAHTDMDGLLKLLGKNKLHK